VVDVLAIALESGVDLLLAEVEGVGPVNISILHEDNIRIIAVVFLLEETVVQARIDHQQDVVQIERVSYRMLVQEDLLLVLA
jgi:hypothetical protein